MERSACPEQPEQPVIPVHAAIPETRMKFQQPAEPEEPELPETTAVQEPPTDIGMEHVTTRAVQGCPLPAGAPVALPAADRPVRSDAPLAIPRAEAKRLVLPVTPEEQERLEVPEL